MKREDKRTRTPSNSVTLVALSNYESALCAQRAELLPLLREAIESTLGNVTRAGQRLWPDLAKERAQSLAWNWTRELGLTEYARTLRASRRAARARQ